MTLSNDSRDRVKKVFEPIALGMGRLGLTPDGLTLIGFGITVVGAILLAGQQWLVGGVVVLLGGVFDMFDGTLARATGQVSKLGAFMDSVFDRWGEALVHLGIIVGCVAAGFDAAAILAAMAMGSAFMVSYTRAKSEGLGFSSGTGMAAIGLMPREVRLVVLSLGLVLAPVLGGLRPEDPDVLANVLGTVLGFIAITASITTIQRILHVRSQAMQQSTTPQAGVPASNGETNT
jgi:CDP-diacylglycerol--glycerol-3-phosphate 3-phosphatidyltransferase